VPERIGRWDLMARILRVQRKREATHRQQAGASMLRRGRLCGSCEDASVPDVAIAARFSERDEASQQDVLAAKL
jgi:hypothetical protein